jgi:hypothetical protein
MQTIRSVSLGVLLLIGATGTGCVPARQLAQDGDEVPLRMERAVVTPRGGAILPSEIRAASDLTLYEAVFRLRPNFFTGNRTRAFSGARVRPSVVVGGGFPEPLEALRLISVDAVAEIRFVEPSDAILRYGAAYTAGLITVRLNGGTRPFD